MTALEVTNIVSFVDLSLLILFSCSSWFFVRNLSLELRWLTVYLIGITLIEIIAKLYYFGWLPGGNLWLMHIYTSFELIVLSFMYRHMLQLSKGSKRMFDGYAFIAVVLVVTYSVMQVWNAFNVSFQQFQLHSKIVVHLSVMAYCALFLIQALRSPAVFLSKSRNLIAMNSLILLYFAGTFAIFLCMQYVVQSNYEDTILLLLFNALLALVLHVVLVVNLWLTATKLKAQ